MELLVSQIEDLMRDLQPHIVITFGPDGLTSQGNLFDITGVPVRDEKIAGMRAHRTQRIELERMPEPLRWIHEESECHVQVFPPPEPGSPVRKDLLEDLEETLGSGR